jgi:hypothetical protein
VAYNDSDTTSYAQSSAPPPLDSPQAEGRNDGYGWQGQAPGTPYQSNQSYQPYQPYGPPRGGYYAGPMAPATSGYAIASLICSILGFIGVFGFGTILGIIFGHLAMREIDRSNGMLQGRGLAQAGLILGYIALGLALIALTIFILFALLGTGAALFGPHH